MFRTSFAMKIILIFVIAVVLQGLAIGRQNLQQATDLVVQNQKSDLARSVNSIDTNLNSKIQLTMRQMELIAQNSALQAQMADAYPAATTPIDILWDLAQSLPPYQHLVVYQQAQIYDDSNPDVRVSEQTYATVVQAQGSAVWIPEVDPGVSAVACAIYNAQEEATYGVLYVTFDTAEFVSSLLYQEEDVLSAYALVLNDAGDLIGSNKTLAGDWETLAESYSSSNRLFLAQVDGRTYQVSGQYNGLTGWVIYCAVGVDDIYAQMRELSKSVQWTVVVYTVLFSCVVAVTVSAMTKPLRQLALHMRNTQHQDFKEKLTTNRKDEVGQLILARNLMMEKINNLIQTVYEQKIMHRDAELRALQAQINPHFLYNTLDSMQWQARAENAPETADNIVTLGKLFAYSLGDHNRLVTLDEELENALGYLQLQKNRLGGKLSYALDIDLKASDVIMPRFLLQPLVENAIQHGIVPKMTGGHIVISGTCQEGTLRLSVCDDGVGMAQERCASLLQPREAVEGHIGLQNVDKRLRLHFGQSCGLKIQSILGEGTRVSVEIPIALAGREGESV